MLSDLQPQRARRAAFALGCLCALSLLSPPADADIANFDLAAKIYTKWLYRNNDSHGILWLGHPAEKDNYSGDNGVGSEVDLVLTGRISKYVKAQVRIKSRFGALWHNWWENGDMRDLPDNSGESLGMNHAEYIKLRGYWFRIKTPTPFINYIHVGSSDFSQFNEWTIGKVRFIGRDNGKGIVIYGKFGDRVRYHIGIIPLPKLWVGPGWTTGIGDTALAQPFIGQDYAYALRMDFEPLDWMQIKLIGSLALDWEANRIGLGLKQLQADPFSAAAEEVVEGAEVTGKVTKILEFGAFVEVAPGVEGLVHISELDWRRVNDVNEVLTENEVVQVKVLKVDPSDRKISLSIKQLKDRPQQQGGGGRGGKGGRGRGDRDDRSPEEILKETPELRRLREQAQKQKPKGGGGLGDAGGMGMGLGDLRL